MQSKSPLSPVRTDSTLMPFGRLRPFGKWLSRRDSSKIARPLNAGNRIAVGSSPEGTAEMDLRIERFSRPFGTCAFFVTVPALKRRAILTQYLRDKCITL